MRIQILFCGWNLMLTLAEVRGKVRFTKGTQLSVHNYPLVRLHDSIDLTQASQQWSKHLGSTSRNSVPICVQNGGFRGQYHEICDLQTLRRDIGSFPAYVFSPLFTYSVVRKGALSVSAFTKQYILLSSELSLEWSTWKVSSPKSCGRLDTINFPNVVSHVQINLAAVLPIKKRCCIRPKSRLLWHHF